jgi:hypothetical protein
LVGISPITSLQRARFVGAVIEGTDFMYSNLRDSQWQGTEVHRSVLRHSCLVGASLERTTFRRCDLEMSISPSRGTTCCLGDRVRGDTERAKRGVGVEGPDDQGVGAGDSTYRVTHRGDATYGAVAAGAAVVVAGDASGVVWFLDVLPTMASPRLQAGNPSIQGNAARGISGTASARS